MHYAFLHIHVFNTVHNNLTCIRVLGFHLDSELLYNGINTYWKFQEDLLLIHFYKHILMTVLVPMGQHHI